MGARPLPEQFGANRDALQRVATHVLARRRHDLCGKFGLRAMPGGFGTTACGPEHEVVRIAGTTLIREVTGGESRTTTLDLADATLGDAAALVGVDLEAPFEAGHDTPPVGDVGARLDIDRASADLLAEWYAFGWATIDAVVAALGPEAEPSVLQLWPEHFDAGCDVAATEEVRVNLGASPGDEGVPVPYLYVGPWTDARPGDADYWNAPFGAVLRSDALRASDDPVADGVAFFGRGIEMLAS